MIKNFYRGDAKKIKLQLKNKNGEPIDITNTKIFFTMKSNLKMTDAQAELQKVIDTHTNPTQGKTEINITSADTNNLKPKTYQYDIQLTNTQNNNNITLLRGQVTLLNDVTRT